MFWNTSLLNEFTVQAKDGHIGTVTDALFDDQTMIVRWFVLDTGTFLPGRKVLLPPSATTPDEDRRALKVDMTKADIEDSPGIESDEPVSRRHEERLHDYYGWSYYWANASYAPAAAGMAAPAMVPAAPSHSPAPEPAPERERDHGDPHLRSANEVTGYYIHATDGEIGHVEDLLLDPENWVLRYIEVDTRNWWPGRMVLVSPHAVTGIDYAEGVVHLDLTRDAIKNGPEYDPSQTIDRNYEDAYYGYYGYPAYWI